MYCYMHGKTSALNIVLRLQDVFKGGSCCMFGQTLSMLIGVARFLCVWLGLCFWGVTGCCLSDIFDFWHNDDCQ